MNIPFKGFTSIDKSSLLYLWKVLLFPLIITLTGIKFFYEITDDYYENDLTGLDKFIEQWVAGFNSQGFDIFFRIITELGNRYFMIAAWLFLFIDHHIRKKDTHFLYKVLLILIISSAFNFIMKDIIERPRPVFDGMKIYFTHSYPSGHAMSSLIFFSLMLVCINHSYKPKSYGTMIIATVIIILLVGLSRIYLKKHYCSDVLAGYAAGMIFLGPSFFYLRKTNMVT